MKKSVLKRASAVLMVLAVMLCGVMMGGADVLADESTGVLEKSGAMRTDNCFVYDETAVLGYDDEQSILNDLSLTAETTGCAVGFYVGKKHRSEQKIQELCEKYAAQLDAGSEYNGAFFIYLDNERDDRHSDYLCTVGNAYNIVPDGRNDTFDAAEFILYHARNTQTDKDYYSASYNLYLRMRYICDEIEHFKRYPEELYSLAESQQSSRYTNPDSYILDSSEFRSKESSYYSDTTASVKTHETKSARFYDEGKLFSAAEAQKVMNLFEGTSQEIGFNLVLYSGAVSRSDSKIERQVRDGALYEKFPESEFTSTVYLYIDLDGKKNACDSMFASNDSFLYYTNGDDGTEDRMIKILRAMESYFPAGGETIIISDILKGLEEYCKQLKYYKSKGLVEGTYYTDPVTNEYVYASNGRIVRSNMRPYKYWWAGLLIGLAVSAIAGVIASVTIKKRYRFRASPSASMYTSKNRIYMSNVQDIFLGTHTSRTRIQSSSGGHSGGFGGGGGGHVGGGGRSSHR